MLAANFLQSDLLKPDSHWTTQDCQMMARALQLAKKGKYTARPNPQVGSVLVKDGKIIGEGYHQTFGQAHAEINALKMAGNEAKGATCYVTLEPCAHTGKTGPCSQALVDAGVKRVVAAMADPNPQVAGKGFKILQDAGIKVEFGLMQSQAQNLNSGFISQMTRKRPWVTCKLAMSVDGRTALANGESKWITGSAARADVQKLRAKQDAIITGIGTLLADDPSLNIRLEDSGYPQDQWLIKAKEKGFKPPVKILLDTQAKAPLKSKLFIKDKESTTEKQVIWFANNHVKTELTRAHFIKTNAKSVARFFISM